MERPRPRFLLVEDHQTTRHTLGRMLNLLGCEVTEVATIAEGLSRLDTPPNCLVLDLTLPDGDGEVLLRRVRDARLRTRVVVYTGTSDPARLDAVSALGPEIILRKPMDSCGLRRLFEMAASE